MSLYNYSAASNFYRSLYARGTCPSCQAPTLACSTVPDFPCTCPGAKENRMLSIACLNAIAFRFRRAPAESNLDDAPAGDHRAFQAYHEAKASESEQLTMSWEHDVALLRHHERRNARLCLSLAGYKDGANEVYNLSRLPLIYPQAHFDENLRTLVELVPTVAREVERDVTDHASPLSNFPNFDIDNIDAHIRSRSRVPSCDRYCSILPKKENTDEAEWYQNARSAIVNADFDATVFCPTLTAFGGEAVDARHDNATGTGYIFMGHDWVSPM